MKINKKIIEKCLMAYRSHRKTMLLAYIAQRTSYHVFGSTIYYHYCLIKLNDDHKMICEHVINNYDIEAYLNNGLPERIVTALVGEININDQFIFNSITENL